MNPKSEGNNCRTLAAGALAIVLLTFAAYRAVLPGSFVMDDAWWTGNFNPLINGAMTPYNLWFRMDFTLAAFGWWVEHLVFGPNPAGYHVVNIALQAISALLFWRLLARLKIPGAWLAATLFAVHPVCVNSVARISELKNTLSLPFFILSFIGYLHYEAAALYPAESAPDGRRHRNATFWYSGFVDCLCAGTAGQNHRRHVSGIVAPLRNMAAQANHRQRHPPYAAFLCAVTRIWIDVHLVSKEPGPADHRVTASAGKFPTAIGRGRVLLLVLSRQSALPLQFVRPISALDD